MTIRKHPIPQDTIDTTMILWKIYDFLEFQVFFNGISSFSAIIYP